MDHSTRNLVFSQNSPQHFIDKGKPPPVINVEVYGFVLWMATFVGYMLYILWAFTPEPILHSLGIHYYPAKYWAIALPCYVCVCLLFLIMLYIAYNMFSTHPLDSPYTLADKFSRRLGVLEKRRVQDEFSIPDISDIPIDIVNKLLYQPHTLDSSSLTNFSPHGMLSKQV
eukprot:TRINITY_DN10582_c0_g1_i6.p1 TRINITY_DN10582_c0_g1~~TRINITY_DN10582_c0_g1_i6.p1  ORF type:complete len:170 (-),score=9.69 TRINITY_DN10582_c0_g1_i6:197-706(-)